jgi:NDP-hexose-3-ketoreductase
MGPGVVAAVDRVFTTPPDLENRVELVVGGESRRETQPATDCFADFLSAVFDSIERADYQALAEDLRRDALALDRLRRAAGSAQDEATR